MLELDRINRLEEAARETEQRLLLAIDIAQIGTFDWDLRTDQDIWNTNNEAIHGLRPGQFGGTGKAWQQLLHPEDRDQVLAKCNEAIETGEPVEHEWRIVWPNGATRWVSARFQISRDQTGSAIRMTGVNVDITARKQAEDAQTLLLKEMDHRVKNLFFLMDSMVALSARSANTTQEMVSAVRGRLNALMRAHDLVRPEPGVLVRPTTERTTLDTIVRTILSPHRYGDGTTNRITITGPDVAVGPKAVFGLALTLHEIATNAAKYGALSNETGSLSVEWCADNHYLDLQWTECGGPKIAGSPEKMGFGSALAHQSIASQLGGKIVRDWRNRGLFLNILVPLDRLIH